METIKIILGVAFAFVLLLAGCWAVPQYSVYSERKKGEAELARASYNRQVSVAEAEAKYESSALLARADSVRALGTAAANRIIGSSISTPYLNWLWINNMEGNDKSVIYVPSGNLGMPIQEATRLAPVSTSQDVNLPTEKLAR